MCSGHDRGHFLCADAAYHVSVQNERLNCLGFFKLQILFRFDYLEEV